MEEEIRLHCSRHSLGLLSNHFVSILMEVSDQQIRLQLHASSVHQTQLVLQTAIAATTLAPAGA